jgi:hypothetical protein
MSGHWSKLRPAFWSWQGHIDPPQHFLHGPQKQKESTNGRLAMTQLPVLNAHLEQQLAYRVNACVIGSRTTEQIFTLSGLRGWMLCQSWPPQALSARLECLAVLSWSAICSMDVDPEREAIALNELARQLEFLGGARIPRPSSLDAFESAQTRHELYGGLRKAAEPGSSRREFFGLPRFNPGQQSPR